jgi:hypothetical protein
MRVAAPVLTVVLGSGMTFCLAGDGIRNVGVILSDLSMAGGS